MAVRFIRRNDGTNGTAPQDSYLTVHIVSATDAIDQIVGPVGVPCELVGVDATFSTASTSGTLQVEKCPVGTAAGSGTDLLSSTMSLSGSAGVTVSGTLGTTRSDRVFATTDRVALDFGGTVTNLANCNIVLRFKRLQSTSSVI
jgi:hypothetical protein